MYYTASARNVDENDDLHVLLKHFYVNSLLGVVGPSPVVLTLVLCSWDLEASLLPIIWEHEHLLRQLFISNYYIYSTVELFYTET